MISPPALSDARALPAAGLSPHGGIGRVWVFNSVLALMAGLLLVFGVLPLPQAGEALQVPAVLLVGSFCLCESWRMYIHFRRNAQSYSLSEIPLVIGVLMVSPTSLVLARLIGAAIGLGIIRRHPPVKLVFNLASFAIEAELITILVRHTVGTDGTSPVVWAGVLLFTAMVSVLGFALSAIAIQLAEGGLHRRQWLEPLAVVTIGGLANASLGLAAVAVAIREPAVLALLLTPLGAVGAAYALYTREHQKRQQLQYLYQSSDLLQRASSSGAAIPELLAQLCKVFRAEIATVTLLPTATGTGSQRTIRNSRGTCEEENQVMGRDRLEYFVPLLDERQRGLIAAPSHTDTGTLEWLHLQGYRDAMATLLQSDGTLLGSLVVANRLSDVSTFDQSDLDLFDAFAAQTSVAVQNTRLDGRLRRQAFNDPITELANRALFMDRLEHALTRRDQRGEALAVIFLDLDDFKTINDSLGHAAGDELLAQVADRLKQVLRPSDTAARFGGDEFAILLEESVEALSVVLVAERLVAVLRQRMVVAGREVTVRASVGVAITESRDVSAEELVRRADVAMYRAKVKGKDMFEVFEPSMQDVAVRRLEVRSDLERAIDRDELLVHYQPVVDIASSTPVGVEALVRWRHPRWGIVPPADFIGVAEETGIIRELGLFVLDQACRRWQEWQAELMDDAAFSVSVNVSPRQLRDPGFVDDVWRVLAATGMPPSHLVLEITEGVMVDDPGNAGARLHELKALGVRISIDDFGTGYSSLASLQALPLDILKIDKAFVDHVADDPRRAAFAQAIIRMGKTLGLSLIAEGVETEAQSNRLQGLGCRLAQGYYFSRPVEADAVRELLHSASALEVRIPA